MQREGSEESKELPWAEQGPLSRPSSCWGGLALAPATTQGVCLQLGPGSRALPFPFWLCRAALLWHLELLAPHSWEN